MTRVSLLQKSSLVATFAVYGTALTIAYRFFVVSVFVEYPELQFSVGRATEAGFAALVAALTVQARWRRPSAFYYSLLVIGVFFPMCVIYLFADYSRTYFLVASLTVFSIGATVNTPRVRLPILVGGSTSTTVLAAVIAALVYLWLIYEGRGHFNLNLADVYLERMHFRGTQGSVLGYLVPWVGKVIIPTFVGIALFRRRYSFAFVLIALEFLLFPLTSHKLYAGIAIALLGIFWLFGKRKPTQALLVCIVLGFGGAVISLYWFENLWPVALLIQRAVFKPALLNFTYATVFENLDPIMLANSSVMPFIEYKHAANPAFLVGEFLKGSVETRSNTGFLGTGYAHFGLVGLPIFGFVVAFLLKLLDGISKHVPVWLVCIISFGSFSSMLSSADLLPALATQGVVLCLLLLWATGNILDDRKTIGY